MAPVQEVIFKSVTVRINSDLYLTYKAPGKKAFAVITADSMNNPLVESKGTLVVFIKRELTIHGEDVQGKDNVGDWEDTTYMTTLKLRAPAIFQPEQGQGANKHLILRISREHGSLSEPIHSSTEQRQSFSRR